MSKSEEGRKAIKFLATNFRSILYLESECPQATGRERMEVISTAHISGALILSLFCRDLPPKNPALTSHVLVSRAPCAVLSYTGDSPLPQGGCTAHCPAQRPCPPAPGEVAAGASQILLSTGVEGQPPRAKKQEEGSERLPAPIIETPALGASLCSLTLLPTQRYTPPPPAMYSCRVGLGMKSVCSGVEEASPQCPDHSVGIAPQEEHSCPLSFLANIFLYSLGVFLSYLALGLFPASCYHLPGHWYSYGNIHLPSVIQKVSFLCFLRLSLPHPPSHPRKYKFLFTATSLVTSLSSLT